MHEKECRQISCELCHQLSSGGIAVPVKNCMAVIMPLSAALRCSSSSVHEYLAVSMLLERAYVLDSEIWDILCQCVETVKRKAVMNDLYGINILINIRMPSDTDARRHSQMVVTKKGFEYAISPLTLSTGKFPMSIVFNGIPFGFGQEIMVQKF